MLEEFAYLGEDDCYQTVIANPKMIAARVEVLKPFPDDFFEPKIEGAPEKIMSMTWKQSQESMRPLPELSKICCKRNWTHHGDGFSFLYMISHLLVKKSMTTAIGRFQGICRSSM
jgi:DNA polymerase-3 subunit alpha (Gram-positive type)